MLEKIGLPEKPSMRGAAWVIDASHCQGCSSQFTFINRKHHCRRCGGLFCGSCTHQRMVLRGQGDSPVRICDPCKKLEDAARFELRYGRKNRSAKGNPKPVLKQEEEILGQILGTDGKQSLLSGHESTADVFSGLRKITSGASSSSSKEECTEIDMFRSMSVGMDNNGLNNFQSSSPEELRNKAAGEKNAYRILKGEGKSEEALQAFKRSKELERQAGALEIALRKSRRMASKAPNLSAVSATPKTDVHEESSSKKLNSSRRGKDDIAAELLGLGWSDADLHDADKKAANLSLEGELSNLIGEMPKKSSPFKADNTQVIAHKKKALVLKREGKLAEAKEELKRAKILEKQLEEQELLGGDEDPDDELSALIYSMDDEDKHDELLPNCSPDRDINFENIFIVADDPSIDGGFDVTDDDMNDPELASALKSFGWTDEEDGHAADQTRLDSEALQCEVVTLKREALSQKRAGNITEAMQLLKKAKLLEKDLESMQTNDQTIASDIENAKRADEEIVRERKTAPKSKLMIQKELLGLKKKALALRREGRVHEAEEELEKGKVLEQQLEDIENAPKRPEVQTRKNLDLDDLEAEVTEQDMHDPALMSVLKNLGWNEDSVESTSTRNKASKQKPTRNKAEIQKELLGIKRKSLALRRQGKAEEAEEELERAKILENQLAEMEASSMDMGSNGFGSPIAMENPNRERAVDDVVLSVSVGKVPIDNEFPLPDIDSVKSNTAKAPAGFESKSSEDQGIQSEERSEESVSIITQSSSMIGFLPGSEVKTLKEDSDRNAFPPPTVANESSKAEYDQKTEILAHKRKALALKREGKISEAREELRRAKILEKSLEDPEVAIMGNSSENNPASSSAEASFVQESRINQAPKVLSSRDRFKLQQESLSHKRNALRLRREGKVAESEAEFELAKSLESQLEVENSKAIVGSTMDDVVVEDMIDPQLMSALKSIGWQDADMESKASMGKSGKPNSQITQLEEEVKAEKLRALNLKRAGKQGEALEALRYAKKLEKKLESLAP